MRLLRVAGLVLALSACGGAGVANCSPCAPPLAVRLTTPDGAPSPSSDEGKAHVCIGTLPCQDVRVAYGAAHPTTENLSLRDTDGVAVTVTYRGETGTGTLRYQRGRGTCGCPSSTADVVLRR